MSLKLPNSLNRINLLVADAAQVFGLGCGIYSVILRGQISTLENQNDIKSNVVSTCFLHNSN